RADVGQRADRPDRLASLVALDDLAAVENPDPAAGLRTDAVLRRIIGGPAREHLPEQRQGLVSIIGVQVCLPDIVARGALTGCIAEDGLQSRRQIHRPTWNVPIP